MVGAVQLGALAACIVLFVPMAMAGWHLSRNKMLFFSGALFITLAVFVHLTPYFPLLFVNNVINNDDNGFVSRNFDKPAKICIALLHNVVFSIGFDSDVDNLGVGNGGSNKRVGGLSGEKFDSGEKSGSWDRVNDAFVGTSENVDKLRDGKSFSGEKSGSWDRVDDAFLETNENIDNLRDGKSSSGEKSGSWDRVKDAFVGTSESVDKLRDGKSSSAQKSGSLGRIDHTSVESDLSIANLSDEKSPSVEKIGSWNWVDDGNVVSCGFQKLGRLDSSDLLNGSWVVVAGDSQARLFSVSLLGLVLGEEKMSLVRGDMFKRHSNYHIDIVEIGMRMDFVWAPYVEDITDLVTEFRKNASYPDVFVMGAGLWHMLHVADASAYGLSLRTLRNSVVSFGSTHMFWLGMPNLLNTMLNTEEKREKMTDSARESYDKELYSSELLKKEKMTGGQLLMINVETLSRKCGKICTVDGMHYDDVVYEAAVHILLNALLIESHQKLRRTRFHYV